MPQIQLQQDGAIATITLDRPPVNALDAPTMQALIAALQHIDRDDSVRVAILTGAGRCFSAGVDLKAQLAALETGAPGPMDLGVALYDAPAPRQQAADRRHQRAGAGRRAGHRCKFTDCSVGRGD